MFSMLDSVLLLSSAAFCFSDSFYYSCFSLKRIDPKNLARASAASLPLGSIKPKKSSFIDNLSPVSKLAVVPLTELTSSSI